MPHIFLGEVSAKFSAKRMRKGSDPRTVDIVNVDSSSA